MIELFKSAKVEVVLNVAGEEDSVKESFSDLIEGATGEDIVAFSQIMATLAPETHSLDHAIGSVSTKYLV